MKNINSVPVQQKPWLKFALMNIHEDMPDDLIKKLIGVDLN